jgi:hypothetical protein
VSGEWLYCVSDVTGVFFGSRWCRGYHAVLRKISPHLHLKVALVELGPELELELEEELLASRLMFEPEESLSRFFVT